MNESAILLVVSGAVWFYLFVHGICTLNLMTAKTHLLHRIGYVLFTMGAFTLFIGPYFGTHTPCWAEIGFGSGLVIFHSKHAYYIWRRGYRKLLRDIRSIFYFG